MVSASIGVTQSVVHTQPQLAGPRSRQQFGWRALRRRLRRETLQAASHGPASTGQPQPSRAWRPGLASALLTRASLARSRKEGVWRRRSIRIAVMLATLAGFAGAARASAVASPAAGLSMLATFLRSSFAKLNEILVPGASRDLLEFLFATALFVPLVRQLKTSPIIGFLLMGVVLGPSGLNWFSQVHLTHQLAEFGIIFFLFEMGLELSVEKVLAMKFDVFVLGAAQFLLTGAAVAWVAQRLDPTLLPGSLLVLGGALALSSSAFVLQLIRDKGQLGTRYGRAAFGVLLFQDLAVVPLLVVIPLLAGGGDIGLQAALGQAAGRGGLALGMIFLFGHILLNPLFGFVSRAQSPEAFLAITLGIVILCSAVTEGLGLSNTLGAFLSGVMLSETQYRHQVEADIAPFRGMLLGLFFTTVGFSINVGLIMESWRTIVPLIVGLTGVKAGIVWLSCAAARLPGSACIQTALLLSPGGEFAFVMLSLADRLQLLTTHSTQLLVTSTALSMALTPVMSTLGEAVATSARTQIGFRSYEGTDSEGAQIVEQAAQADPFIVVCGFGRIGQTVCNLLNAECSNDYIAFDNDPEKAIQARSSGLPVFLADCTQPEVMNKFRVGKAGLVVVAIGDKEAATQVARAITRHLPSVIECDPHDNACYGGFPKGAYQYAIEHGGLASDTDYPYKVEGKVICLANQTFNETCGDGICSDPPLTGYCDVTCSDSTHKSVAHISSWVALPKSEDQMAIYLAAHGPISVGIDASGGALGVFFPWLQFYHRGIADPRRCTNHIDHGVLAVGYGEEDGKKYWLIKNSWGAKWGEQGYFRLIRGKALCGIADMASSAVTKSLLDFDVVV